MSTATSAALSWEVSLPGKRVSIGSRKPTGTLVLHPGTVEEERLSIPAPVARILSSKQESGEVAPSSRAELLYLLHELSERCARSRIERLIDRREYSKDEVAQKLRLDGYPSKTIEACVNHASEIGLISNDRYADSFIRSKVSAGWGIARIEYELGRRGIDLTSVPGWPYDYLDPDDELARATELAQRRRIDGPRAYERLVRYLTGRGFSLGVASAAARARIESEENC